MSAPQDERTLGRRAVTFQATVNASRRAVVSREVTRQTLYADEEADYDAGQHAPSSEYLSQLAARRVTDNAFYEDPYAEADGAVLEATDVEIAQFRADLASRSFVSMATGRVQTSAEIAERRRREEQARTGTQPDAAAAMQLRPETLLDRVAAEHRRQQESVVLTAPTPLSTPASVRAIDASALRSMLSVDCLRGLTPKVKANFLGLSCVASLFRELQPLLYVHEPDRRHENAVELIERLVSAGAKFEAATRMLCRTRLGAVLDAEFYGSFLTRTGRSVVLGGGHEHYDAVRDETRLLVLTFRCVRRTRENNHNAASSDAQRELHRLEAERLARRPGVDLVEEAQREAHAAAVRRHPAYADPWADTFRDDTDDNYDGGQDVKILARHFMYRLDVVCVEAIDARLADDTRAGSEVPASPIARANAAPLRAPLEPALAHVDFGGTADDDAEKALRQMMPLGAMRISHDRAVKLAGLYRADELKRLLNLPAHALAPLCVRAFAFSADVAEEQNKFT